MKHGKTIFNSIYLLFIEKAVENERSLSNYNFI